LHFEELLNQSWEERLPYGVLESEQLNSEQVRLLVDTAAWLATEKEWEATQGFAINAEMVATIAVQASWLVLGLPDDALNDINNVIVSATTMTLTGEHMIDEGVASREPQYVLGHTGEGGDIYLAWDEIEDGLKHPRGSVVFHEFAHRLDDLDGVSNGTPPMQSNEQLERWVSVCTPVYKSIVAGRGPSCIDEYAATNPAEFFAVVSEVFFCEGPALNNEVPKLYDALSDYYRRRP